MRIIVDENIPQAEIFSCFGEVQRRPGRDLSAADVRDADALIVRSITKVNQQLLQDSAVRFVGTCTIGTDHLDLEYLHSQQIGWANAPGCNAQAVVEYVLATLHVLAQRTGKPLAQQIYGVVGVGQVGRRLAALLRKLGFQVLLCDPPRQHVERAVSAENFVDLATILRECDVISLHTPLQRQGSWPTYHLLSSAQLESLRQGAWLINAARGAVIDNRALAQCLLQRPDLAVVLDVWEQEPCFNSKLAQRCQLATPHIAGYSLDGKIRGTQMIAEQFARYFSLPLAQSVQYPLPVLKSIAVNVQADNAAILAVLATLLYDPRQDDADMRSLFGLDAQQRAAGFDRLRKNYRVRRELPSLQLHEQPYNAAGEQLLRCLLQPETLA